MRFAYAAVPLMLAAVAGCGGGGGSAASWEGPPPPSASGNVDLTSFEDHAQSVDETWEGSPALAAGEFLRLDRRTAALTSITARSGPEGAGPTVVTVTIAGLPDDSVRAERWRLTFAPEDGTYRLTEASRAQSCRGGRGHQLFRPGPCV